MCVCVGGLVNGWVGGCLHMCMCMCVYVCVCLCSFIYLFTIYVCYSFISYSIVFIAVFYLDLAWSGLTHEDQRSALLGLAMVLLC